MITVDRRKAAGIVGTAAIVAFAITAWGTQATGHGNGAKDPTSVVSFDRAGVGGRKGCDVQSWPYIAPECIAASESGPAGDHAKAMRRLL